jgi:hypothetical protein
MTPPTPPATSEAGRPYVATDTFWERLRRAFTRLANPMLFGWFVLIDVVSIVRWLQIDAFGGNVQTYHAAAQVWLAGGDPWASPYTTTFGPQALVAPPPSLAPYLLTAWLPVGAATWVWVGVGAIAAVFVVRALRLPWWWILFPPLLFDVFWGSIDPILLLFLVSGPRWVAGAFKVTFIPAMIAEQAWRDLLIAGVLLVLSLAVMPWGAFLTHLADLAQQASAQTGGGSSAASFLPLAVVTAIALAVLGWRRGWYLFVPALWPLNATGYSVVSMPVLGAIPFVAAAVSIPVPYLAPVVIIATAIVTFRRRERGSFGVRRRRHQDRSEQVLDSDGGV